MNTTLGTNGFFYFAIAHFGGSFSQEKSDKKSAAAEARNGILLLAFVPRKLKEELCKREREEGDQDRGIIHLLLLQHMCPTSLLALESPLVKVRNWPRYTFTSVPTANHARTRSKNDYL